MPHDGRQGELSRTIVHEPNYDYPEKVQLRVIWRVDGRPVIRSVEITSDEFFGHGSFGAPIPAEAIVQRIERMRRAGPPVVNRRGSRRG